VLNSDPISLPSIPKSGIKATLAVPLEELDERTEFWEVLLDNASY
jgi:hypothetical protein